MKNMQKLAFGLLVAGLAIGFSAFKTATAPITYYQVAPDQYNVASASGDCDPSLPTTNRPCSIHYTTAPSSVMLPFSYANKPSGGNDSSEQTIYVP